MLNTLMLNPEEQSLINIVTVLRLSNSYSGGDISVVLLSSRQLNLLAPLVEKDIAK